MQGMIFLQFEFVFVQVVVAVVSVFVEPAVVEVVALVEVVADLYT
jgi:hypothetical protein